MAANNGYPGEDGTWVQTSTLWLNVKAFGALAVLIVVAWIATRRKPVAS